MHDSYPNREIVSRFRGFLPVVVDVETGGFEPEHHALLEIAAQPIAMNRDGRVVPGDLVSVPVKPFPNARMDPQSLKVNGIDPNHPERKAVSEAEALQRIFAPVRRALKETGCTRAVLVGHNPAFDLAFLKAAVERNKVRRNPFHPFTTFDTATLGGLAYGQTVLARAAEAAKLSWDSTQAHSADYDTRLTAELFCRIVNTWHGAIGWPEHTSLDGDGYAALA